MQITVNPKFKTWAKGFSGCDGGNLNGSIWFCGIEYGGNEEEGEFGFADVSTPGCLNDPDKDLLWHQYGQKTAKLYAAIMGQAVTDYAVVARERRLFGQDSDTFRLNLYPIAFHHDGGELWAEWLYKKTGLPTKSIYRAWCQIYRFAEMRRWATEHKPRLIVGTGATYLDDFLLAFDGPANLYAGWQKEQLDQREICWRTVNDCQTVLAVTPFLGNRYGLNSDALLTEAGQVLNRLCAERFGEMWLRR